MSRAYLSAQHQQIEWRGGGVLQLLLDSEATEGNVMLARQSLRAGDATPIHLHTREDEMFVLLSGRGVFWYGDDELLAEEGSVIYLPRNVAHGYHCLTDMDLLTLCTPAGLETFFRSAGHDLATPKPARWEYTAAGMGAAAEAAGVEILGPPRLPSPAS